MTILTEREAQESRDRLREVEQLLLNLGDTSTDRAKELTAMSLRKVIRGLREDVARFEARRTPARMN